MGMPAARITDMHTCPMVTVLVPHVGGPIVTGMWTVLTGMLPLATRAVDAIRKMEKIAPSKIRVVAGRLGVRKGGVAAEAASAADEKVSMPRAVPDILAYLQNETELTRSTLVRTSRLRVHDLVLYRRNQSYISTRNGNQINQSRSIRPPRAESDHVASYPGIVLEILPWRLRSHARHVGPQFPCHSFRVLHSYARVSTLP
jgi:uncharacterized Zn-binding protein involved in type VI secretion